MQKILAIVALALLAVISAQSAPSTVAQFINDNNVLNYALTLENLEAAYYAAGVAKFGSTDAQYTAAGYPAGTGGVISTIATQEQGHANLLTSVLGSRKWAAVPPCQYNFTSALTSVTTFVSTLAVVEGLGTSAYDGAANTITNAGLLGIAAGIATVEARHTALLQVITNSSFAAPFPNIRDPALAVATVYATVLSTGFIVSCPSATAYPPYAPAITVSSGNASSFAPQDALTLRGNSSILTGSSGLFYNTNAAGGAAIQANDIAVLNYALTLENLEAFFYANFTAAYSTAAIQAAYPTITNTQASIIQQSIALIASHELNHVLLLNTTINAHGATPVAPCQYNFAPVGIAYGSTNFTQFLTAARALEQTGVAAYVGAIGLLANPFVAQVAATIATVEARHASYIMDLANGNASVYGSAALSAGASPSPSVFFGTTSINTFIADSGLPPTGVVTFLVQNGIFLASTCPSTNPSFYGNGVTNSAVDFFSDNAVAGTPTGTFPTAAANTPSGNTPGGNTPSGNGNNGNPSTTTVPKGNANTASVAFCLVALLALLF